MLVVHAQLLQHAQAVEPGQPQVEDNQIVQFTQQHLDSLFAVDCRVHCVTELAHGTAQAVAQDFIVFGNQDAHCKVCVRPAVGLM